MQFDLLLRGLSLEHLGTEALTWYDLLVFVEHIQTDPSSALSRHFHGERWSIEVQLLANIQDTLAMANWQRGGKKSAPKPKRTPRPWEKPKATTIGKDAIPISEFNDWWDSQAK